MSAGSGLCRRKSNICSFLPLSSSSHAQMLTVSSTEPRTLRHCDPPQVHPQPTDENRPACRTVPLRPLPGLHAQGISVAPCTAPKKHRGTQLFKTIQNRL